MSLRNAFAYIINLHGRNMNIFTTVDAAPGASTIKVANSNYFRNLEGPAATVSTGREFCFLADQAKAILGGPPKIGHRLKDPEYGIMILSEVREMPDIGGATMGYRVRTK